MRWNYYKLRQLSLLQSAMDSCYKLRQLFYYKVRHGLLQVATGITKCDGFITNCDRYYKVRWLLQIATVQGSRGFNPPPPPLRSFQTCLATHVSCLSLFHTKNNIMSYNISSSPIDHDKKTVATSFFDSLIINSCQMQDRFLTKISTPANCLV